jgi:hypothetical protein
MKTQHNLRLSLQPLEDRSVPSVTASVVNGSLIVKGDATAASNVAITASDTNGDKVADTFAVTDGGKSIGTFSGVTKDVTLRLSNNDDTVSIDLGGLSTPRGLSVSMAKGTNTLTIADGTVSGALNVNGGSGADNVTLGGTTGLTVKSNAALDLGAGTDGVQLTDATFSRNLLVASAETVTLDAKSTVARDFAAFGGSAGTTVNVAGTVKGSVAVAGGFGRNAGGDTLDLTGTVSRDVAFFGGGGSDTLTVTGKVGGSLFADLGSGDDTASVGGTVTGSLNLAGGAGNDTLTVSGKVGKRTFIDGGAGNDTVAITATASLGGNAVVSLGAGNDKLTVDPVATVPGLTANGGSGTDTFVGTSTKTGFKVAGFES